MDLAHLAINRLVKVALVATAWAGRGQAAAKRSAPQGYLNLLANYIRVVADYSTGRLQLRPTKSLWRLCMDESSYLLSLRFHTTWSRRYTSFKYSLCNYFKKIIPHAKEDERERWGWKLEAGGDGGNTTTPDHNSSSTISARVFYYHQSRNEASFLKISIQRNPRRNLRC